MNMMLINSSSSVEIYSAVFWLSPLLLYNWSMLIFFIILIFVKYQMAMRGGSECNSIITQSGTIDILKRILKIHRIFRQLKIILTITALADPYS